jgi:hypothetical protein
VVLDRMPVKLVFAGHCVGLEDHAHGLAGGENGVGPPLLRASRLPLSLLLLRHCLRYSQSAQLPVLRPDLAAGQVSSARPASATPCRHRAAAPTRRRTAAILGRWRQGKSPGSEGGDQPASQRWLSVRRSGAAGGMSRFCLQQRLEMSGTIVAYDRRQPGGLFADCAMPRCKARRYSLNCSRPTLGDSSCQDCRVF